MVPIDCRDRVVGAEWRIVRAHSDPGSTYKWIKLMVARIRNSWAIETEPMKLECQDSQKDEEVRKAHRCAGILAQFTADVLIKDCNASVHNGRHLDFAIESIARFAE